MTFFHNQACSRTDPRFADGEYFFLEPEQRLEKFAPPGWRLALRPPPSGQPPVQFLLFLRFRFYPKKPEFVRTPATAHQLYLQLRQSVLEGQLQAPRAQLLEAAALALQAEFGDKPQHVTSYFEPENYVPAAVLGWARPEELQQMRDALCRLHAAQQGHSRAEAERAFVETCQSWPTYGAHFYQVSS